MDNFTDPINNLYNEKQNYLEKNGSNISYTNEEVANDNNVLQCFINQDNNLLVNNGSVFQNDDGEIFYACLAPNATEYDTNEQSISLLSQDQLSNVMLGNETAIDGSISDKIIQVHNYYTVPANQIQFIKYQDEDDIFRNESFRFQECRVCSMKFSSKRTYLKHMSIHENDREFKCSWCKQSYNHEENLLVHIAVIHTDECFDNGSDTCLKCPICNCAFSRKKALQGHCLVHQVDEELMCDHCGQPFKSKILLNYHLNHIDSGDECEIKPTPKLLKCKLCHEVFENVGKIKKHYAREHPKGKTEWPPVETLTPAGDLDGNESVVSDTDYLPEHKTSKLRRSTKRAIQTIKLYAKSKNKPQDKDRSSGVRRRGRPRKDEVVGSSKTGYSCETCGKTFKTPVLLRRHEVTHTGVKAFECPICKKSFTQKSSVKIHLEVHKNIKSFRCKYCYKTFTYEHNMKTHMRVVHKENSHYDSMEYKERRVKLKSEPKSYANVAVGDDLEITQYLWNGNHDSTTYRPNQNTNIYMPSTSAWDKSNISENCGILVSEDVERIDKETGTMQLHERIKDQITGFQRFRCRFCFKLYKNSCDLSRHVRIHLNEKPFVCYLCRKSFRLRSVLKTHLKSHWKLKEYGCDVCGKSFNLRQTLKVHERLHNAENLKHACKFCDKKFNTMYHYNYHLATHQRKLNAPIMPEGAKLEPIVCDDVPQSEADVKSADSSTERPFNCQYCPKSYKLKKYLQEHCKEHLSINKHCCNYCQKQFLTSRSLQQHIRVQHLNRKRYNCTICSAQFLTKSSLYRHGLVHSNVKPYMCPICKRRFKARLYCERHIKHGICAEKALNSGSIQIVSGQVLSQIQNSQNSLNQSTDDGNNFQLEDLDVNGNQNSSIIVTNFVDNFSGYQNPTILSIDSNKNQSNYITSGYIIEDGIEDLNRQQNVQVDNSDNIIGLLDQSMELPIYVTNSNNIPAQMIETPHVTDVDMEPEPDNIMFYSSEVVNDDKPSTSKSSLADRFPILKASLFSDDDNIAKKAENAMAHVGDELPKSQYFLDSNLTAPNLTDKLFHGCANCDELFKDSDELALHVKTNHKLLKDHICQVCYKAFSAKLSLWAHSKTHEVSHIDGKSDSFFNCVACNQQFLSVSSLSRHVRMQHNEYLNLYRCNHCNKTYKTTRELDSHIKQMFFEYDALIINSNYIGGTNSSNSFVVRSKNETEIESKDNLVDIDSSKLEELASMDEKDVSKASFKELIRAAKEKTGMLKSKVASFDKLGLDANLAHPYICSICNKGFTRTSNLRQHLRVHTKTKPYQCTKCDGRFRHRCSLKTHLAAKHSVVTKLLRCHICSKFLRSNVALRTHMKMHLGKIDRPFLNTNINSRRLLSEPKPENNSMMHHTVDLDEIKVEYSTVESTKKLKCIYCSNTFDSMDMYNNHSCENEKMQSNS